MMNILDWKAYLIKSWLLLNKNIAQKPPHLVRMGEKIYLV